MVSAADRELLRRARYSNAAFILLQKRYVDEVLLIIRSNCRPTDVDDILQEFYVHLIKYARNVQDVDVYLKRCAFTAAKRFYRRKYLSERLLDDICVADKDCHFCTGQEENLIPIIKHALVNLPKIYQDLVSAVYFCGKSLQSYAAYHNINYNTAKVRHRRALELLRERVCQHACIC